MSGMDVQRDRPDEIGDDIKNRLEVLKLDDKWYDDFKILKQLPSNEPAIEAKTET
jgi:hypothetical protein